MTQTGTANPAVEGAVAQAPRRRTFIVLTVVALVLFVIQAANSNDIAYDTKTTDIAGSYDYSYDQARLIAFSAMAFCGLLLFIGAALRKSVGRSRSWYADAAFLGAAGLAATFASWVVTDMAMWRAVQVGDDSVIRALATISDAGFLPLMASMIALYVGTGLAGLTTGSLPRWFAVISVVLGVLAPLGPAGLVSFLLLPLWLVAVSVLVRAQFEVGP